MEKQNAEMMEYLKSLENIVQFQSYVLEHIHDDFSVLFKVLSKCFGMDAMLTYSCTESGLVDSVVYRKDSDDVTKYQTYLNAGKGRLFNTRHYIYTSVAEMSDDMREELLSCYEFVENKRIVVCSGIVEGVLYSIVLVLGEQDEEVGVDFNDCSDMFLNTVHLMMENKIMSEKMRYDSEHDLLTGLYNRRSYFTKSREEYTMLSENIHGFRMGGDEFIMVALNCAESDVIKIKERWEKELEIVNEKYGMSPCSVAVGTAFAKGSFRIEELCKIADDRMYEDKKRKHNCR